jgi:hypothetical protein
MWSTERLGKRLFRVGLFFVVAFVVCVITCFVVWKSFSGVPDENPFADYLSNAADAGRDETFDARIEAFCGDCHALPRPESFPRYAWYTEVCMGYEFYAKSGRTDLEPPPVHQTVRYYRSQAPLQLNFPTVEESATKLNVRFEIEKYRIDSRGGATPAVSNLRWLRLDSSKDPMLIVCDMRSGAVEVASLQNKYQPPKLLARLHHPCHVEPCDLDDDGLTDLVVADLGSYPPGDHDLGRVVWLRRTEGELSFEPIVIGSGLGRVCDARPCDFDSDGDQDLVVAVFGMERTGRIVLLRNVAPSEMPPRFETETVDPRPGTIHVPIHDFDGDGNLDFAALISQEYEQVAVYVNQHGSNQRTSPFRLQTLWEGPDLTFGSSGIELVDLDADEDIDILYTNGDAFDNGFVNPRHGVQWLENRGGLDFEYHRLTDMVGAYAASAGDIDLDGDLDIITVAWIPGEAEPGNVFDKPLASVICLEQKATGEFVRHTLETDMVIHATLAIADFDQDGDLDFATGSHTLARSKDLSHWMAVWWNQTNAPGRQ